MYVCIQNLAHILGENDKKLMPEFPGIIWYNFGIFGFNLDEEVIRDRQKKFNYV